MRFFVPDGSSTWHVELCIGKDKKAVIDTMQSDEDDARVVVQESKIKDVSDIAQIARMSAEMTQHVLAGRVVTVHEAMGEWHKHMLSTGRSTRTAMNNHDTVQRWACAPAGWGYNALSVAEVTPEMIAKWVNRSSEHKLGTRRMWLAAIRSFFAYCKSKNWTAFDPSSLVEVNHKLLKHEQKEVKHKKTFSDADVNCLIGAASRHHVEPASMSSGFFKAALIIGRDLALRIGDVCNLEWACFDFAKMQAVVWTEKGKARIAIPMTERVLELLMDMERADPVYVFPKERALINDPSKRAIISVAFSRFFKALGFDGFSFHSLRATYATTMAAEGATVSEIAAALGHANTDTTKAYIRREGAAKL